MGITPMGAERLLSRGCPAHLPGSDGPRALISTGNAIGLLEYRTATFAPKLPRVHTFTEGGETPSDRRGCVGNHGRAQESARVLKGEAEVAVGSWSTRLGGGERLEQAGGGTGHRHTGRPVPGSWAHASASTTKWSPEARSGQEQDGFPVRTQRALNADGCLHRPMTRSPARRPCGPTGRTRLLSTSAVIWCLHVSLNQGF